MLLIATIFTFAVCVAAIFIDWGEAKRLNLHVHGGCHMAKIGDSFRATIAPTNAAGAPAPVSAVEFLTVGGSYNVVHVIGELTAVYTAVLPGSGNRVSVTATAKSGSTLADFADLPDVEEDAEEATKLNLSVVPA